MAYDEVAISADGTTVVYRSAGELHVRALDQLKGAPLRGAATAARNAFMSPDEVRVGCVAGNTLQKVSIQGGPADTSPTDAGTMPDLVA